MIELAVRVKVEIRSTKRLKTSALVNTGLESERPLVVLPKKIAEKLGFETEGLKGELYLAADRTPVFLYPLSRKPEVSVITENREVGPIEVEALMGLGEDEAVLSDKASGALKLSIIDPGEGTWKFRDEDRVRKSVKKEIWL